MFELVIFIILSVVLECGMGILYGVGVGYDPMLVYPATIILNFLSIIFVISIIDRLLEWKKGLKNWLEKRLSRGQKLIDKYGWIGIIMIQLAIVGRLLCIKPTRLLPALFCAIVLVATAYLGIALGIFKVLLA